MTMSDIVKTIVLAILGSQAVFAFIQFLITRSDQQKKAPYAKEADMNAVKAALMVWMQGELDRLMTGYINDGHITPHQFKHVQAMVKAYEGLGGDGYIHELFSQTCDLIGPEIKNLI